MKNVIYLVADALRPDYLGCYGNSQILTTEIDRLAIMGVRFQRVISSAPWTVPSIATHLTGRYAHRLCVFSSDTEISQSIQTVFQVFKRYGYYTAAFFDSQKLFEQWSRDVDHYGRSLDILGLLNFISSCAEQGRPFFLFNLYRGTHIPYVHKYSKRAWYRGLEEALERIRSGPAGVKESRYRYARAVEHFSEWYLRAVLDVLEDNGLRENTAIVITADHGESWGERFANKSQIDVFALHGPLLHEEILWVPLIMYNLGDKQGAVVREMVRSVDILPTLLDALCIEVPAELDGVSLQPALDGKPVSFPAYAFSATTSYENPEEHGIAAVGRIALTEGRWRGILDLHTERFELYDLGQDSYETHNLAAEQPERAREMRDCIRREVEQNVEPYTQEESSEILKRLEELGYV